MTDKLDEILDEYQIREGHDPIWHDDTIRKFKAEINELTLKQVMELIGEYETITEDTLATDVKHTRNELRAELRQSAERIWK